MAVFVGGCKIDNIGFLKSRPGYCLNPLSDSQIGGFLFISNKIVTLSNYSNKKKRSAQAAFPYKKAFIFDEDLIY